VSLIPDGTTEIYDGVLYPIEQTDNSVRPEDGPQLEDDDTPLSQEPCLDDEASGDVVRFLNQARSQLGYREGSNNDTKYGIAFGMNHVAWCQMYDWWVPFSIHFPHLKTAATMVAVADARKHKTFHSGKAGIAPGDSIYFHWPDSTRPKDQPDHVGIVELVRKDGAIQTIEGNSSDMVRRNLRRANILGYIRHAFPAAPTPPKPKPKPHPMPATIRRGSRNAALVKRLQKLLNARRYKGADGHLLDEDGIFGPNTVHAVKDFQRAHGMFASGVCGTKTWKALGL
jgi:hypothetical protein